MKAKKLQLEIEESLISGLEIWLADMPPSVTVWKAHLHELMRERARNLAMGLASRTVTEEDLGDFSDIDEYLANARGK